MERYFHLKDRGTTVKTEFLAGLTAFMAMAYILIVNADLFGSFFGKKYFDAVYIATAVSAVFGSALMGLLANLPLSQAAGMGINAFFVNTVCREFGFTYSNALVMVLADGLLFLILSLTGVRKHILEAIPFPVRSAISGGIGLFIAQLGLQSSGFLQIAEIGPGVFEQRLHSFNIFPALHGTAVWEELLPLVVTFAALLAIGVLNRKKVRGSVLWAILGGTALYYLLGFLTLPEQPAPEFSFRFSEPFQNFAQLSLGAVFRQGFDFSAYIRLHGTGSFILALISATLAFSMVDMFDTLGALYGACDCGGLLDRSGRIPGLDRAMLADASATCFGAVCGSSPVTTFIESSAGIAEGGRTGLTALVTAACFLLSVFFAPLARLVPACATAAALIYVGVLMMGSLKEADWKDPLSGIPAFLTLVMIPFTGNISYGIAFGLISHLLLSLFSGNFREIKAGTWILSLLFSIVFLVSK